MNLLFALMLLMGWLAIDAPNIGDTPFSQLNLNMVFRSIASIVCILGAIYYTFKSLESERIWPWRWTRLYFLTLLYRCIFLLLTAFAVLFYSDSIRNLDTWAQWAGGVGIFIWVLNVLFSTDFSFEEKAIEKLLSKTFVGDNRMFSEEATDDSGTSIEPDDAAPKLKPYLAVVGSARRDAVEKYVRKRIMEGNTETPKVTELWTEDGDSFPVTFGK